MTKKAKTDETQDTTLNLGAPQIETKTLTPHEALVQAIAKCGNVSASRFNPHFKSKYFGLGDLLAEVKPVFAEHGLVIIQIPTTCEDTISIQTQVLHGATQHIFDFGKLGIKSVGQNLQQTGSALTYLRRYAIATITGVATDLEDDDGNSATKHPVTQPKTISAPAYQPQVVARTDANWVEQIGIKSDDAKNAATSLLKSKGWLKSAQSLADLDPAKVQELMTPRMRTTFLDAVRVEAERIGASRNDQSNG